MNKVVYNDCYGGFSLSSKAKIMLRKAVGNIDGNIEDVERHNPALISTVEFLGEEANGDYASLAIHTLEGNKYLIENYDGRETVMEPKDIQWITIEE